MTKEKKGHNANIRVAVRCRPALDNEIKQGATFDKLVVDGGSQAIR